MAGAPADERATLPLLVELVGVAGTGKSTLYASLLAEEGVERPPIVRRTGGLAALAGPSLRAGWTLARRRALHLGAGTPELVREVTYLEIWPEHLRRGGAEAVVFDQGPVFYLTRRPLRAERLRGWWEPTVARWASLLSLVVLLEAPADVLAQRIDARDKEHALKGADRETALRELVAESEVLGSFVERLERAPAGPRVLRVDASVHDASAVSSLVGAALRDARDRARDVAEGATRPS